jgi:hypothetical protein
MYLRFLREEAGEAIFTKTNRNESPFGEVILEEHRDEVSFGDDMLREG